MFMTIAAVSGTSQMIDRSKPPQPGPEPKATFPHYDVRTLSNGMRVLTVENRKLPLVTMSLVIRAGSALDGDVPGLADMTATLMMKGTATRTATQIAEEIDFLGASLSTGAGWDASSITMSTLTRYLDTVLEILSEVLLHPSFPAEVCRRTRRSGERT